MLKPKESPVNHRQKLMVISTPSIKTNLASARFYADKAEMLLGKKEDMSVCKMVSAITTLALLNINVLHINVEFTAECAGLVVKVHPANSNYFGLYKTIFRRCVYLDQPSSLLQLKTLEDDLIELVADAKDKLVGAV